MNKFMGAALVAASLSIAAAPVFADEAVSENRAIDARVVKIKLDGVINLNIKQGPTASLVVYGERQQVDKVTTRVHGDTLVIETDGHNRNWHFGKNKSKLRAELVLPKMNEFTSHGVGSTDVSGFSGDQVKLVLDGAGSITVTSNYKSVDARLGGVGSMKLNTGNSDKVDLNLRGAGSIEINGDSKMLRASLGGVGSLEAQQLRADTVDLDLTGLGGATVYARNSATLNLTGLGSATVYGKPANRNATARGLGSVSWN
jgi:hypothetical protein